MKETLRALLASKKAVTLWAGTILQIVLAVLDLLPTETRASIAQMFMAWIAMQGGVDIMKSRKVPHVQQFQPIIHNDPVWMRDDDGEPSIISPMSDEEAYEAEQAAERKRNR